MQKKIKVSYIILTHNRLLKLKEHVVMIKQQEKYTAGLQIIVTDDNSQDNTKQWCIDDFQVDGYVRVDRPVDSQSWPAQARNNGIRIATGELLIFADEDCLPNKELIKRYIEKAEPEVCQVGWRTLDKMYLDINSDEVEKPIEPARGENRFFDRAKSGHFSHLHFTSGTFAIMKETLQDVRFDEGYRGYGYEDLDFALMLAAKGVKFIYNWKAIIVHDNSGSSKTREQKNIEAAENRKRYNAKLNKLRDAIL